MSLGTAVFSDDKAYRYLLTRQCPGRGHTAIVMVNPSVANAEVNDATIGKLRGFGERHEWGEIRIVNLFALISPDVRKLKEVSDPVGPQNDYWIWHAAEGANQIIVAWGSIGKIPRTHRDRIDAVVGDLECARRPILSIGQPAMCGQPKHPLYQPYDSPLLPWRLP
jgi:hypothetical protein